MSMHCTTDLRNVCSLWMAISKIQDTASALVSQTLCASQALSWQAFCLKVCWHVSHWNGRSSVWQRRCNVRFSCLAKDCWHVSHWNGRSSVWLRICWVRWSFHVKDCWHVSHWNGRSSVWLRRCLVRLELIVKVFWHISHCNGFLLVPSQGARGRSLISSWLLFVSWLKVTKHMRFLSSTDASNKGSGVTRSMNVRSLIKDNGRIEDDKDKKLQKVHYLFVAHHIYNNSWVRM
jgi:hypothetical protein